MIGSGISLKCPGGVKNTHSIFDTLGVFLTCISSPKFSELLHNEVGYSFSVSS